MRQNHCVIFKNDDFICKWEIGLNLLFGKLTIFKFEFRSISPLFLKCLELRIWEWLFQPYHSQNL